MQVNVVGSGEHSAADRGLLAGSDHGRFEALIPDRHVT